MSSAKKSRVSDANAVLSTLKRLGSARIRDEMGPRYGIAAPPGAPALKAFGVPVGKLHDVAKRLGRDHELALALWDTGWYEARMLAAFVDEPARVTAAQMDRWARDFDNWGICDTVCFHLFDRVPPPPHELAFRKVEKWAGRNEEFVKRAAFALLASLALHHRPRDADEGLFLRCLPLIERAASDDRNFVKKGVSWALRGIGKRGPTLKAAAIKLARRLAASPEPAGGGGGSRWVGKDVLKDLTR